MLKKYLSSALLVLVINLAFGATAFADTKEDAKFTEKVKTNITKIGTGKDARVEIKLRDKTKLKGYVSQISENSFTVVDEKTGNASEIAYPNAKQVKGNNLSTGVKVVIGVGIAIAIVVLIQVISPSR